MMFNLIKNFAQVTLWPAGELPLKKQQITNAELATLNEKSTNIKKICSTWLVKSSGFILSCFHNGHSNSNKHLHTIGIAN